MSVRGKDPFRARKVALALAVLAALAFSFLGEIAIELKEAGESSWRWLVAAFVFLLVALGAAGVAGGRE